MRLDKYLAQAGLGTRSEVKKWIRSGRVLLDGREASRPEETVGEGAEVVFDGREIPAPGLEYYMLYKPAGIVSATEDLRDRTVVELITCPHARGLFPVGRLDKDTEGLLILTNDGALAHRLLSPRKHVEKTYFARVKGLVTQEDVDIFAAGMDIGDDKPTQPAVIFDREVLQGGETELKITVTEGRYHQIKRMFQRIEKPVLYLKRLTMGGLALDGSLKRGEFRRLTEEEVGRLREMEGRPTK